MNDRKNIKLQYEDLMEAKDRIIRGECPYCGHKSFKKGEYSLERDVVSLFRQCNHCDFEWVEDYKLYKADLWIDEYVEIHNIEIHDFI